VEKIKNHHKQNFEDETYKQNATGL